MSPAQILGINPDELSRCEERRHIREHRKNLGDSQKSDAFIKESIERALWKDDVLRAIEYPEIDVYVKKGVVYLTGHIVNSTSRNRVENAVRTVRSVQGFQNHLILDDLLTNEVARSLVMLEHTYKCKFFTGVSHGLVSLNGLVNNESVKLLAERCAASIPNVRGVINNLRVSGAELKLPDLPFLQPTIGEVIYFLDGISGTVKQVIINPSNRRVVAMIVGGTFSNQQQELKSLNSAGARSSEHLVVISMDTVRYMTRVSGFLLTKSDDRKHYMDFDPTRFTTPNEGWMAPYPYCPGDVLLPLEERRVDYKILEQRHHYPLIVAWEDQPLRELLLTNDSLGG